MKTVKTVSISESVSLKIEVDKLTAMISDLTDQLRDANQHSNIGMEKGIFIWSKGKSTYILIRDIVMMKAESNYSVIFLSNGHSHFTSHTLKYWVEKCDTPLFIRVHKSYVINYKNIVTIDQSAKTIQLEGGHTAFYSKSAKKLIAGILLDLQKPILW